MRAKRETLATAPKYRRLSATKGAAPTVDRKGGLRKQGLIRGASLVTRGEALGHGVWLDEEFVDSVARGVNQFNKGVKARFTHPGLSSDGLGTHLGRAMTAIVEGSQALADFHFTASSHRTPEGDLSGYVMDMAEESPEDVAISIVYEFDADAEKAHFIEHGGKVEEGEDEFGPYEIWDDREFKSPDPDNHQNLPHARLALMRAADFVGDPAANPDGLFSREQQFAEEADAVAAYAFGLSKHRPRAVALGIDAERVRQFANRFLHQHSLEIKPMRKQNDTPAPADDDAKPAETQPAAEVNPAETKPAEPATPTPAEPAPVAAGERSEAKRFREAFGDRGAVWFAEGLDFEQARNRQVEELRTENQQLQQQLAAVNKKLGIAAATSGEQTPVGFDAGGETKRRGLASKIRMPGQAK